MRIGIDARFLTHPQQGGFKTYTENLVHSMREIDEVNQFYLYVDRPPSAKTVPENNHWKYRTVRGDFPVIGMPLREQFILGQQMAIDHLDVVHLLCNTAPVRMKGNYVVTLHDIIQLTADNPFSFFRNLSDHKSWAILAYSKWTVLHSVYMADRVITVSQYERDQIVGQLEIESDRVSVIHLAPNPIYKPAGTDEKNQWRTELPVKFGIKKKFILGVGYEPRKNIHILIEIFAKLAPEFEDLDLVIVCAEKNRRLYFQRLVGRLNLDGRVIILGALSPRELLMLYNLAETFVYPSERESFGLPPLEAISCGTPTIAMNATSLPEILGDGALWVDGKDKSAWNNAIGRVLANEDLRARLIDRGLRKASTFSWQKCALETIQIYSDLYSKGS